MLSPSNGCAVCFDSLRLTGGASPTNSTGSVLCEHQLLGCCESVGFLGGGPQRWTDRDHLYRSVFHVLDGDFFVSMHWKVRVEATGADSQE